MLPVATLDCVDGSLELGISLVLAPSLATGSAGLVGLVGFLEAGFFTAAFDDVDRAAEPALVDLAGGFRAAGFVVEPETSSSPGTADDVVEAGADACAPETLPGFEVERGARGVVLPLVRVDFFATSPVAPDSLPAASWGFGDRVAGFFRGVAGADERGFAGVFGLDDGLLGVFSSGVSTPSPNSTNGAFTGASDAGSTGVSSGEAGGTVVTDPTYQLPADDSRQMSFWGVSEPVNPPCALLRSDNNKPLDDAPNTGAAIT